MQENIDFGTFLIAKKIDARQFEDAESSLFGEWKTLFEQISPASFSAQKLFLINSIRRKYHLEKKSEAETTKPKMMTKPKFKKP